VSGQVTAFDHEALTYLLARLRKINRCLGLSLRYFAEDDIHELRVEIKRLRASTALTAWMNPAFRSKRVLKPIRKVFKAAGRLRDLHVQRHLLSLHLVESARDVGEFSDELNARETGARIDYAEVAARFEGDWFEEVAEAARMALSDIREDEATWRISQRLAVSVSLLADLESEGRLAEADLHRVRILCKEARYMLEILRPGSPAELAEYYGELDHHLRQVHRALGLWHDADVGQKVLGHFLKQRAPGSLRSPESYRHYAEHLAAMRDRHLGEFAPRWEALQRLLHEGTSSSAR
jgi:CHAD domain-containing protein